MNEIKKTFLPIFQDVQTKMLNLSGKNQYITTVDIRDSAVEMKISYYCLEFSTHVMEFVTVYDFWPLHYNLRAYRQFKERVKRKFGLVL